MGTQAESIVHIKPEKSMYKSKKEKKKFSIFRDSHFLEILIF
jgi:hypothetical protein